MAEYNLKVTARRITATRHTLEDGTSIDAASAPTGSYVVDLPDAKTIIMAASDFEAASAPLV